MSDIFIVAGGDRRYVSLAEQLAEEHRVYTVGFSHECFSGSSFICAESTGEITEKADVLILPMPVSEDGITLRTPLGSKQIMLSELIPILGKDCVVFGGMISDKVRAYFEGFGFSVSDYFRREELVVLNAEATAEGAVEIALRELPEVLLGMKVLIFGMGRISRLLIKQLGAFGADITVTARRCSSLAWAESMGCKAIKLSDLDETSAIADASLIINTVPAIMMNGRRLAECDPSCLVLDLASKPGGVDINAAESLGVKTIWALGIPGKSSPVTAGRIIKKTIENILNEINDIT